MSFVKKNRSCNYLRGLLLGWAAACLIDRLLLLLGCAPLGVAWATNGAGLQQLWASSRKCQLGRECPTLAHVASCGPVRRRPAATHASHALPGCAARLAGCAAPPSAPRAAGCRLARRACCSGRFVLRPGFSPPANSYLLQRKNRTEKRGKNTNNKNIRNFKLKLLPQTLWI